jgi:hypothetical protein
MGKGKGVPDELDDDEHHPSQPIVVLLTKKLSTLNVHLLSPTNSPTKFPPECLAVWLADASLMSEQLSVKPQNW